MVKSGSTGKAEERHGDRLWEKKRWVRYRKQPAALSGMTGLVKEASS